MKETEKANGVVIRETTKRYTAEAKECIDSLRKTEKDLMRSIAEACEHNMPRFYINNLLAALDMLDTTELDISKINEKDAEAKRTKRKASELTRWYQIEGCTCCKTVEGKKRNEEARKHGWKRVYETFCPVHGQLKGTHILEEQPYLVVTKYISKEKEEEGNGNLEV